MYSNTEELCSLSLNIIKHIKEMNEISNNAYITISDEWNYSVAVERMLKWSDSYLNKKQINFADGIMSKDDYE